MAFVAPLHNEILSIRLLRLKSHWGDPGGTAAQTLQPNDLEPRFINSTNAPIISNSFRKKQNDRGEQLQGRNP
ncbi:hypothetical protein M422DRAFT_244304 [Sphaerobolus stellatus SS14]|nr:hypothetical protein M422DRAFT_244304 [Sphaerobolus stellatus SS14]